MTTMVDLSNDSLLDRLRRAGRDGVRQSEIAELRFVRLRIKELRAAGYRIGEAHDLDADGNHDTRFLLIAEPAQAELAPAHFNLESEQGPKPPSRDPARDVSVQPPTPEEGLH